MVVAAWGEGWLEGIAAGCSLTHKERKFIASITVLCKLVGTLKVLASSTK